ncbi:hypothetical protein [Lichenicoccus roseus]|nr:hypothetical protein [Lichenicoccus roseus]
MLPGQDRIVLDALLAADSELAVAEQLLQAAYGRPVGSQVRALRRQA